MAALLVRQGRVSRAGPAEGGPRAEGRRYPVLAQAMYFPLIILRTF